MNVHILPTMNDTDDARRKVADDTTIACEFCYNGGKMKISGPGTITLNTQGIYLLGHRPASGLWRGAVRVSLLFGGMMLIVVPMAVYQAWLGMDEGGLHWSSYAVMVFVSSIAIPKLYRLSRALEGGGKNAAPVEGFIPARELVGVDQHPLLGTMAITYRPAGSILPASVQIVSETSLEELKGHIDILKQGSEQP